jgi:hypothetical protein
MLSPVLIYQEHAIHATLNAHNASSQETTVYKDAVLKDSKKNLKSHINASSRDVKRKKISKI